MAHTSKLAPCLKCGTADRDVRRSVPRRLTPSPETEMNAAIVEADRVSNAGVELGERLWLAMESAVKCGVPVSRAVVTFECALEQISEEFTGREPVEQALYIASAMLAIKTMVDARRRRALEAKATDTYGDFVSAQFDQAA